MSVDTAMQNGTRHDFSKFQPKIPVPDLLAIQLASWENFLQEDVLPEKRENKGLEAVFKNMFPVEDTRNDYVLEYKHYYLGLPKYTGISFIRASLIASQLVSAMVTSSFWFIISVAKARLNLLPPKIR